MTKKYIIAKYTGELRYKPQAGDVREDGDMYYKWEEYNTLEEAEEAVKQNPFRYIPRAEEKSGMAGKYYDCEEYAIEQVSITEDGEMICGLNLCRVLEA